MGSNPGIFGIMMLFYGLSSSFAQLNNVNMVFLPYEQQGVDCSLQKIAYAIICAAVLGYITWHASGMGLLPTNTGDWIMKIPIVATRERVL